jgi:hypothetical protein
LGEIGRTDLVVEQSEETRVSGHGADRVLKLNAEDPLNFLSVMCQSMQYGPRLLEEQVQRSMVGLIDGCVARLSADTPKFSWDTGRLSA